MNPIVQTLRTRRRALEITQVQLSLAIGANPNIIGRLESGVVSATPEQIAAIDKALHQYETAAATRPKVVAPKVAP